MRDGSVLFGIVLALTGALILCAQTPPPPPAASGTSLKQAGIKPIGDWQVDPGQTAYLESLFSQASTAANAIVPGPEASAQRHAIDNLLRQELENFVISNATSAYAPGLHVLLGHKARMRCSYSRAMQHYTAAFNGVAGSPDPTATQIAHEASGALAKLLAVTGMIAEFDALQSQAGQMGPAAISGYEWGWADEMRGWVVKHPEETYKCGLYCLDQLGRMTQSGQFLPKNILETDSSTNGFTVSDLVRIGTSAGLRVHAALLGNTNFLPIPCILHLRCQHFVLLRERRGDFYNVNDLVQSGPKWLTLDDLLEEISGCVVVSDAIPATPGVPLSTLDTISAAAYRGRCHVPIPADHDDSPLQSPTPAVSCGGPTSGPAPNPPAPPGGTAPISPNVLGITGGINPSLSRACSSCSGMAGYFISEPWLNLWLQDIPISYVPSYGDPLALTLSYTFRRQGSVVSGDYWHGSQFGTYTGGDSGIWSCSWLSFGELATGDAEVDLMLPAGGWATFNFPLDRLFIRQLVHALFLPRGWRRQYHVLGGRQSKHGGDLPL